MIHGPNDDVCILDLVSGIPRWRHRPIRLRLSSSGHIQSNTLNPSWFHESLWPEDVIVVGFCWNEVTTVATILDVVVGGLFSMTPFVVSGFSAIYYLPVTALQSVPALRPPATRAIDVFFDIQVNFVGATLGLRNANAASFASPVNSFGVGSPAPGIVSPTLSKNGLIFAVGGFNSPVGGVIVTPEDNPTLNELVNGEASSAFSFVTGSVIDKWSSFASTDLTWDNAPPAAGFDISACEIRGTK